MGIDETRYGFMDEGWATTFEYLINQDDMGTERASAFYRQFRVDRWAHDPSALEDLPIVTPGDVLRGAAYGNNAYGKASLGYLALKDMLGDDTFRRALHGFMDRWHGRHPLPWDFFNSVNDVAGRNLDWFWRSWYFENAYIDLALGTPTRAADGWTVPVRNVGGMPAPFDLRVTYADGSTATLHQTSAVWAADQHQTSVALKSATALRSVELVGGIWEDADTTNDRWGTASR